MAKQIPGKNSGSEQQHAWLSLKTRCILAPLQLHSPISPPGIRCHSQIKVYVRFGVGAVYSATKTYA
eukprot:10838678-Prorocentrum_lima.AAC.1